MQERLRRGSSAAAAARRPSQPDRDTPVVPRTVRRSHSRRENKSLEVTAAFSWGGSVIRSELGGVQQHPQDVRQALGLAVGSDLADVAFQATAFLRAGFA